MIPHRDESPAQGPLSRTIRSRSPRVGSSDQAGIALLMVIFMIALASAILFSLTDSTYVAMRLNSAAEQRIKAEYILKSAMNVAQVLIKNDITNYDDPVNDAWMAFVDGREVPGSLLALPEPNIKVSLLIASLHAKVPLIKVDNVAGGSNADWRQIVLRLFQQLGFDDPQNPMNAGPQGQGLPSSAQLVANLVDYIDTDKTDFAGEAQIPRGIEESLPNGQTFPNSRRIDSLPGELASIPGFSPARIQRLLPFVTQNQSISHINVNAAPIEVLRAVVNDPADGDRIEQCRNPALGGSPIQSVQQQLTACGVDPASIGKFRPSGNWYEVIAKVEYGTAMFMASGELESSGTAGRLPKIKSFRLY